MSGARPISTLQWSIMDFLAEVKTAQRSQAIAWACVVLTPAQARKPGDARTLVALNALRGLELRKLVRRNKVERERRKGPEKTRWVLTLEGEQLLREHRRQR